MYHKLLSDRLQTGTKFKNFSLEFLKQRYHDLLSCEIALAEMRAIQHLPAGTRIYYTDLHGNYNKLLHVMQNNIFALKYKIDQTFQADISDKDKTRLLKICCYPNYYSSLTNDFSLDTTETDIIRLAKLLTYVGSKYTRVHFDLTLKTMSLFYSTIQALVSNSNQDKINPKQSVYQKSLIDNHIKYGNYLKLIKDITAIIKRLLIYKLDINGDIFDRGPDAAKIMDYLSKIHDEGYKLTLKFGNHDLLWLGAAKGSRILITEALRVSLRYANHETLEDSYDIPLAPLAKFANDTYTHSSGKGFASKVPLAGNYTQGDLENMQKAIAVIGWKLEAQEAHLLGIVPHLALVTKNDKGELIYNLEGKQYLLTDQYFPTLDLANPSQLTPKEQDIIDYLQVKFLESNRLQQHMRFFSKYGSIYNLEDKVFSLHSNVPLNDDLSFKEFMIEGNPYGGKVLLDKLTDVYRNVFSDTYADEEILRLLYLGWKGKDFCTFGKSGQETFTRALVADKSLHHEERSVFYKIMDDPAKGEELVHLLSEEFGEIAKIFTGHIPISLEKGENPVKANGKIIFGDGNFSDGYADAGFVYMRTSRGEYLQKLGKSVSIDKFIYEDQDIESEIIYQEKYPVRRTIGEISSELATQVAQLELLRGYYLANSNINQ